MTDAAPAGFQLLLPGPAGQRTGGYRYDARIVTGEKAAGHEVRVVELPPYAPYADAAAREAAAGVAANLPDDLPVVVDGLALPVLADVFAGLAARLPTLALVHHPLSLETGLAELDRVRLARLERRLLPLCRGAITTSTATAAVLADFGVAADAVEVVLPGTDPVPEGGPRGSGGPGVAMLAVGAVIPRKGYATLIEALAHLGDLDWTLRCLGALDRAPETTAAVRAAIARHGLERRAVLAGEADDAALAEDYRHADLFVLSSHYEGYGMVFAEAQAWGLPVVASGTGAVRETVGAGGIVVPPGNPALLAAALRLVLCRPDRRAGLAAASYAAGQRLPDWNAQAQRFMAAVARLTAGD